MRTFLQDQSVKGHRLTRDTLRRILWFATPYRGKLAVFLVVVAASAAAGATTPLLFRRLVDDGIVAGNRGVVIVMALAEDRGYDHWTRVRRSLGGMT